MKVKHDKAINQRDDVVYVLDDNNIIVEVVFYDEAIKRFPELFTFD